MNKVSTDKNISDRAQKLLKTLIERYIREGQPVGSHTLARDSNLDLSAATIRNIIADLEKATIFLIFQKMYPKKS